MTLFAPESRFFARYGILALPIVPVLVGIAFVGIEDYFLKTTPSGVSGNGVLNEVAKRALDLNLDLNHTLATLSSGLIGAVAYYVKTRKDFRSFTTFSIWTSAGIVVLCVFSIFFGHLWEALLRDEVALDRYKPEERIFVWPERMQYFTFMTALSWFAVLAIEREPQRDAASGGDTEGTKIDQVGSEQAPTVHGDVTDGLLDKRTAVDENPAELGR